jgi:hypothetical protein
MLAVVVLLFALSWLPLYVVHLILFFFTPPQDSASMELIQDIVVPVAQWLGTSNSCMNPLVYCLFSKRIRERIQLLITCASRQHAKRRALSMYSSTRQMTVDYCNGQVKLALYVSQRPRRLTPNSVLLQAHPMLNHHSINNGGHGSGLGGGGGASLGIGGRGVANHVAAGSSPSSNDEINSEEHILNSETVDTMT